MMKFALFSNWEYFTFNSNFLSLIMISTEVSQAFYLSVIIKDVAESFYSGSNSNSIIFYGAEAYLEWR